MLKIGFETTPHNFVKVGVSAFSATEADGPAFVKGFDAEATAEQVALTVHDNGGGGGQIDVVGGEHLIAAGIDSPGTSSTSRHIPRHMIQPLESVRGDLQRRHAFAARQRDLKEAPGAAGLANL